VARDITKRFGEQIMVIGPAPDAVKKVKDRFRFVLYVKAEAADILQKVKDSIVRQTETSHSIYIQFEMD
jgi:primosomal protein N'